MSVPTFPSGKFMATVKVGAKGQIVIPAEVREQFGIEPGNSLLLLADETQGIAIPHPKQAAEILRQISSVIQGGSK